MKHAYALGCTCPRCVKECVRRTAQSLADPRPKPAPKVRRQRSRRPIHGSQEWAETYSDNLGYSGDY